MVTSERATEIGAIKHPASAAPGFAKKDGTEVKYAILQSYGGTYPSSPSFMAANSYLPRPPPTSYKPSTSTKRNSDFFPPRLPADPFSNNAFRQRDPIVLNAERLFLTASNSQPRRDVILVLGGQFLFPSQPCLQCL